MLGLPGEGKGLSISRRRAERLLYFSLWGGVELAARTGIGYWDAHMGCELGYTVNVLGSR